MNAGSVLPRGRHEESLSPALVCSDLRWCAQACVGVLRPALVCSGLRWCALACVGVLWPALVCSGKYGCVQPM